MNAPFPKWEEDGVFPPVDRENPASPYNRSPHRVLLADLVRNLGISPPRLRILRGFLEYRRALHTLGIVEGIQWVNGSFVEDVETRRGQVAPNDIDVVTFAILPAGMTLSNLLQLTPRITNPLHTKNDFLVDGYIEPISELTPNQLINVVAYWYGLWSHTKRDVPNALTTSPDFEWKGFLQVSLASAEDATAEMALEEQIRGVQL